MSDDGYKFVMRRIVDDAIQGELALSQVSFGQALNGYGSMSAVASMEDPLGDAFRFTAPKRWTLCVEKAGVLEWSGPLWTRQRDYTNRLITIGGNEWGSIYDRRIVHADFEYGPGLSAFVVVTNLLVPAYAPPGGVIITNEGGASNPIDGVFTEADHPTILAAFTQIANDPLDGFQYRWEASYTAGNVILRELRLGRPLIAGADPIYDWMGPGGGGTIDGYSTDEADTADDVMGWSPDGYMVHRSVYTIAVPSPPDFLTTDDLPLVTQEGITYGDLTDAEITDQVDARATSNNVDLFTIGVGRVRHTVVFRDTLPMSAFPKCGQTVRLYIQDTAAATPKVFTGLVLARSAMIGADDSTEVTLTVGQI